MTLWEMIYPKFKFNEKPIILLEMFAGIGAQRKALENLGLKIDDEKSKICEWAYNSILAYNAIHIKDFTDYSNGLEKETMLEKIKGISVNYNEPLTEKQLKAKPIEWVKKAYNNIVATRDLIDISNVKGKDLGDLSKDQVSIMTYSFPCQDLSLAGKREGMDEGTRSGLLWQVERILLERKKEHLNMPNILLLENVPEAIGTGNKDLFSKWQNQLEKLGYSNYVKILNAKDYGIPQNRKRVFMVSILGEYAYSFPHKIKLKCHLKDLLEKNVDEKYYLSQKLVDFFTYNTEKQKENGNGFKFEPQDQESADIGKAITTKADARMDDNFIFGNRRLNETLEKHEIHDNDFIDCYNKQVKKDIAGTITTRVSSSCDTFVAKKYTCGSIRRIGKNIAKIDKEVPTLTANSMQSINHDNCILIKEATKKGYKEAHDGDGIDISGRMQYHRGTVQKGLTQTLKTECDVGVVVNDKKDK